jgi:hypothetical protein
MIAVKANELATARELYAQAYEPLRSVPTLEVLDHQHTLLGAADALEKRANAIHDWPIDEGRWARVATIATSVRSDDRTAHPRPARLVTALQPGGHWRATGARPVAR